MKTVRIAVLAYSSCMPTQLFGIADVLRIAGDLDKNLGAKRGVSLNVELIRLPGQKVTVSGGFVLPLKRPVGHYDLLIIPGFETQRQQDWAAKLGPLSRERDFISRSFARGTAVAAVCVGSFLLGEAGLLDGRNVTTAWLFASDLAARYPQARVNADAILLEDGAVVTSAAVSSAFDLAIHLIKRYLGAEVATATAAVTLLPTQRASQSPYVDTRLLQRELPTFSQNLIQWFEHRLTEDYDLKTVAQAFHVSGRTLIRRTNAETGKSPLTLLQEARVEQSKRLLISSNWPLARIVESVGYADLASFTRLFTKLVGETPVKYRRRRVPAKA
ncbi:helix-turn-helix domain-containing protein [Pseudomonas gingeri]|uniref:GlxA family transcriptional regulator n=1 Tax=Pseudomonas gingeri TaxID=117681 RepID=UPI00159F82B7|nr:helix-turn-helix domain-containing protein [Pseudomonas gingeri]NWD76044.1 helix-turn-helix domain-containing protein [Pseudomonas gingeri]